MMTSSFKSIVLICLSALSLSAFAAGDKLATGQIAIDSRDSEGVLNRTLDDLREVFQRFHPSADGGEFIKELVVGGSRQHPTLAMTLKKCVTLICQTVDLNAYVSLREVNGSCDRNFVLEADLSKSSQLLTDYYSTLNTDICYQRSSNGKGELTAVATAIRASGFKKGIVQREILSTLKAQANPIIRAVEDSLKANY